MQVFLDTEFNSLGKPQLLSLGMVTGIAEPCEFYAELELTSAEGSRRAKAANAFVRSTVLGQWGLVADASCMHDELGRRASNWLITVAACTEPIEIVYDSKIDADLLEYALHGSGRMSELHGRVEWAIVSYLNADPEFQLAKVASWKRTRDLQGLRPHHALADARALPDAFIAMHGAQSSEVRNYASHR